MLNEERLGELWQRLETLRLDAFLVINMDGGTLYSPNPFYLTGLDATWTGVVLITRTRRIYLVTDPRYGESAEQVFPAENVRVIFKQSGPALADTLKEAGASPFWRIGFESDVASHEMAVVYERYFKAELHSTIEFIPLGRNENPVMMLRRRKEEFEIERLRRAQEITACSLREVVAKISPGMQENEIAMEIERQMRRNGATGVWPSQYGFIVASGGRSSLPHGKAGENVVSAGEVIQFDVGAKYKGYYGDFSRVVFLGEPDPELNRIFYAVSDALKAAIDCCLAGATSHDVEKTARERLGSYEQFFMHGIGHGIGLSVHEFPSLSLRADAVPLEVGHVITIEPGVYIPGLGGIRLEDMVVIRDDGPEVFAGSAFRSDELIVL